ncbi:MAG: molybdopterin-guanine dinucleotide biosynthesis protein MobB [Calditrichaceae bacterium]
MQAHGRHGSTQPGPQEDARDVPRTCSSSSATVHADQDRWEATSRTGALSGVVDEAVICRRMRCSDCAISEALQQLDMTHIDLVLVEGFKAEPFPKIELHRPALGKPLLFRSDRHIIAIATDTEHVENCPLPHLDLNDADAIAHFILQRAMQDPSPDDEGEVKDSCRSKRSFSNASAGR